MLRSHRQRTHTSAPRLRAGLAAAVVCAAAGPALAGDPPSGLFLGFDNLTNSSFVTFEASDIGSGETVVLDEASGGGAPVTLTTGETFGNEEFDGVFTVSGSGSASSAGGVLRAEAVATVTENTVGNFDTPFFESDGSLNFDGVPEVVGVSAFASFTDRLQYGGTATNYTSRYLLRVTGELTAPGFVAITIQQGDGGVPQTIFLSEPGVFNETIATETFVHGGAPQFFSLSIQATADVLPDFFSEGQSSSALFGSTLEVIGLELRDADTGALLTGETVTTAGGATVPVTIVPEPTTAALLGLSGLALVARRRRAVA